MARIRTIKPEFWDSPSVAKASPWARLLFIAMWNWADDHGRGTANLKELEGFAFPNDDYFTDRSGNTVHFRSLVAEVSECFDVVFYEAENRPFYAILTWDAHQRNERRSKESKYPAPPVIPRQNRVVAEIPCNDTETRGVSVTGTGEQGNRGTGEQKKNSSSPAVTVDDFESVWVHWPKKTEKKKSLEKFKAKAKTRGLEQLKADIVKFGRAYAATTEKQFTPALCVWLGGERWEDDLPAATTATINAQWDAAMNETKPDPCAGGHRWAAGECIRCLTKEHGKE